MVTLTVARGTDEALPTGARALSRRHTGNRHLSDDDKITNCDRQEVKGEGSTGGCVGAPAQRTVGGGAVKVIRGHVHEEGRTGSPAE